MADLVVVNYNDSQLTKKYVNIICKYNSIEHIVVVDNSSTDNSFKELQDIKSIKVDVIQTVKNGGYGYGNNFGIKYLINRYKSKYILITNPDVTYEEDVVIQCENYLISHSDEKCAVCAPHMLDSRLQPLNCAWNVPGWIKYTCFSLVIIGKFFNLEYISCETNENVKCDCVAGSMLMINVQSFIDVGMYDENIFLFCEETMMGIKYKEKGYHSYVLANVEFVHAHSASIKKSITSRVQRQEVMWKSRLYVLNKYYHISGIRLGFSRMIKKICILESIIFSK